MNPLARVALATLLAASPAFAEEKPSEPEAAKPAAESEAAKPWHEGLAVEPTKIGETPFASRFGDRVIFGGQFKAEEIALLKESGVRVVVNLRGADELTFDEKKLVEEAGMKYVHVPLEHGKPMDPATLAKAVEALAEALDGEAAVGEGEKVMMHCASSNRVGLVWSIYRARKHGLSLEAAIDEGKKAGMKAPALLKTAEETIAAKPAAG